MLLARIVLLLAALTYAGFSSSFLAAPGTMAALVGVSLAGPTADNDIRAVYGGLGAGLALFLTLSAFRAEWHRPALWVVVMTLTGMALARCLSWAVVGMPDPIAFLLHASEVLGLILGLLTLRVIGRRAGG